MTEEDPNMYYFYDENELKEYLIQNPEMRDSVKMANKKIEIPTVRALDKKVFEKTKNKEYVDTFFNYNIYTQNDNSSKYKTFGDEVMGLVHSMKAKKVIPPSNFAEVYDERRMKRREDYFINFCKKTRGSPQIKSKYAKMEEEYNQKKQNLFDSIKTGLLKTSLNKRLDLSKKVDNKNKKKLLSENRNNINNFCSFWKSSLAKSIEKKVKDKIKEEEEDDEDDEIDINQIKQQHSGFMIGNIHKLIRRKQVEKMMKSRQSISFKVNINDDNKRVNLLKSRTQTNRSVDFDKLFTSNNIINKIQKSNSEHTFDVNDEKGVLRKKINSLNNSIEFNQNVFPEKFQTMKHKEDEVVTKILGDLYEDYNRDILDYEDANLLKTKEEIKKYKSFDFSELYEKDDFHNRSNNSLRIDSMNEEHFNNNLSRNDSNKINNKIVFKNRRRVQSARPFAISNDRKVFDTNNNSTKNININDNNSKYQDFIMPINSINNSTISYENDYRNRLPSVRSSLILTDKNNSINFNNNNNKIKLNSTNLNNYSNSNRNSQNSMKSIKLNNIINNSINIDSNISTTTNNNKKKKSKKNSLKFRDMSFSLNMEDEVFREKMNSLMQEYEKI